MTIDISDEEENNTSNFPSTRSKCNRSVEEVDGPTNTDNVSSDGFIITPDKFVVVYTDGACSNNGKNNARAGLGVWFNHHNPL